MIGGCVPGGSPRNRVCEMAVTCAFAVARLAVGCKNTFMIETPLRVVDSICAMFSTVVVRARSKTVVTGMLIFGKISTGVRRTTIGLMMKIAKASTMNV